MQSEIRNSKCFHSGICVSKLLHSHKGNHAEELRSWQARVILFGYLGKMWVAVLRYWRCCLRFCSRPKRKCLLFLCLSRNRLIWIRCFPSSSDYCARETEGFLPLRSFYSCSKFRLGIFEKFKTGRLDAAHGKIPWIWMSAALKQPEKTCRGMSAAGIKTAINTQLKGLTWLDCFPPEM